MTLELNDGEAIEVDDDKRYTLAKLLTELMDDLGCLPTFDEARKYPKMPKDLNQYAFYFGSFDRAIRDASYYVRRHEHPEDFVTRNNLSSQERAERSLKIHSELIREATEKSNELIRRRKMEKQEEILDRLVPMCRERHGKTDWISKDTIKRDPMLVLAEVIKAFGSIKGLRKAIRIQILREKTEKSKGVKKMGKKVSETPEEMWSKLKAKAKELGKVPTDAEIRNDKSLHSSMTYQRYFGQGWKKKMKDDLAQESAISSREKTTKVERVTFNQDDEPGISKQVQIVEETTEKPQIENSTTHSVDESLGGDEREIPIKVIVPKGIKGTIHLTLEF